jgi:hypothetical protein
MEMIKSKLQLALCGGSLALSLACGSQQKPVPNDEVTVPMSVEDEEALDQGQETPNTATPVLDAGPPPGP